MPSDLSILFSDSTMRQSCARLSSSESNCVTNGTSLDGCVSASLDKMGHDADTATSTYVVEVTFQGKESYEYPVLCLYWRLYYVLPVSRRAVKCYEPCTPYRRSSTRETIECQLFSGAFIQLLEQNIQLTNCFLQFLRLTQAHLVSESEVLAMNEQQPHRHNVWFPFHFDIPSTIYNRDNGLHLASCEETLPPSLHVTSDMIHRSADLYVRGECQISYHVRARITTAHGGCVAEAVHPVIFIPTHGSPPPLCVDDFPHEYTLYSSQNIYHLLPFHKRHLFIQTEEPPPLQFSCSETSFTTINLKLLCRYTTSSNNSIYTIRPPPDMFYIVQSTLQAATFSSVVPQHNLPKQGDIEPSQLAMVKTTVCPPQTRKLRFSPWTPIAENRGDQGKLMVVVQQIIDEMLTRY